MDEYIKKADILEYLSARKNQVLKSPLSTLDAKFEVMEIFDFVTHRVESADVVPMRHGRWIEHDDGIFTCSECGNAESNESYFCRYCGAKMMEG